jgi:hypothetical protein
MNDAIIRDILFGIVGNALWSLVAQSGTKALEEVRNLVSPPEPSLVAAIHAACDRLEKSILADANGTQGRLLGYLRSPELECVVRQLFATSLIGPIEGSTLDAVKGEFLSSMSKHLDIDEVRLRPFAASILEALISVVEESLKTAIEKDVLSAHEAKSASRHRVILDELANLPKNIEFLRSNSALDLDSILQFETRYRELVGEVHSQIKPPHLESGRRVPIDEIFVAPRISFVPRRKTDQAEILALPSFLSRLYRAVLLGNPGGGKSTTSAKICFDLATRYSERLFAGREVTPVIVILREYGSQKKLTNCSILQFLEQQASSRYQLVPPLNAFEYLLLNGRLLIVFDGLDELLDSSYRQEITTNVEAFCKLYPSVPVLVTSREVGYEQAPLNDKTFELFQLAPFDDAQVREYAEKWFARDEDYSVDQKAQKAQSFFFDSALVPDLRSNPLMLGLMCNLYRAEGYIPRNRPEVYGKCSIMLFERWDKSRDILVQLPFEEHIRPAMQDLAFWIYSNDELQGGVTEHLLIQRTSDYLCKWVFDDFQKASLAASGFIGFCTGRAWVFTDTGTTREGERLFQFTHRTFLEYFTACYLVSVHPTPEGLMESLAPRILKGEWDVVAQLAFQVQSKQVHGAADDLLAGLLSTECPTQSDLWRLLSFAERTLEFLVPSPKVRREITRAALAFWLEYVREGKQVRWGSFGEQGREITEHIGNLLLVTAENRDTIADEIEIFLRQSIASVDREVAALAAELALSLANCLHRIQSRGQVTSDVSEYWDSIANKVVNSMLSCVLEVARGSWCVAVRCYWHSLMPLADCIEIFGIPFLLISVRSAALGHMWFYPPGYLLLDSVLGLGWRGMKSPEENNKKALELESLAQYFLCTPVPWILPKHTRDGPPSRWVFGVRRDRERVSPGIELSSDANFAIVCLLAVDLERSSRRKGPRDNLEGTLREEQNVPENIKAVLFGRLSGANDDALKALDSLCFSSAQHEFLRRWLNREIDLVEVRGPKRRRRERLRDA